MGNDRFLEATLEKVHQKITKSSDIEKMIHQVCRHFEVKEKDLVETGKNQKIAKARAMLSWLVRESKNLTLTELSKRLLKDISGLSRAATLLAEKAEKDQSLKDMMEHFRRDLL